MASPIPNGPEGQGIGDVLASIDLPKAADLTAITADITAKVNAAIADSGIEITPPAVKVSTAPEPPGARPPMRQFSPLVVGGVIVGLLALVIFIAKGA